MRDHTGWRANIGVVCSAANIVVEPEFYSMSPPGVAFCATRMSSLDEEKSNGSLDRDELAGCTRYLVDAGLQVIVLGTPAATTGMPMGSAAECMRIAGAPLPITAVAAVVDALRVLSVGKVTVIGTGLPDHVSRESEYLVASGLEVSETVNLGLSAETAADGVYRAVRAAAGRSSDGIYIASCAIETVAALAAIEEDLARPVVSTVQACFWAALRAAGILEPISGFGALLAR